MQVFKKQHTSFQNAAATLTGTNTGNHSYEYQIDTGSRLEWHHGKRSTART